MIIIIINILINKIKIIKIVAKTQIQFKLMIINKIFKINCKEIINNTKKISSNSQLIIKIIIN